MNLASFTELVANLVRDDDGRLAQADIDTAVTMATNRYSKDQPDVLVEDVTAPTASSLNLPASWDVGFSEIQAIEYPLEQSPPCYINPVNYQKYRGPGNAETIKFISTSVAVGATARVTFSARHDDPETFDDEDVELVASFAAAHLCEHLSALYGHSTDTTIQSDSVDHVNKGRDFALRAKSLRGRYEAKFQPRKSSGAAAAVAVVTHKNSNGGNRMFH